MMLHKPLLLVSMFTLIIASCVVTIINTNEHIITVILLL